MFTKSFKKTKEKLQAHYKGIGATIAILMLAITYWNELTEFMDNIFQEESEPFVINHQLGINFGFENFFFNQTSKESLVKSAT